MQKSVTGGKVSKKKVSPGDHAESKSKKEDGD